MVEPINLNRARKAKVRAEAAAAAARNRVSFGRTKAERAVTRLEAEKAARDLDQKKRD